jgi:O-antigen ligase
MKLGALLFRVLNFLKQRSAVFWIVLSIGLFVWPWSAAPMHTPKNLLLIVLGLSLFPILYGIQSIRGKFVAVDITLLESILIFRLLWVLISNPDLLSPHKYLSFYILVSLVILTHWVRRGKLNSSSLIGDFVLSLFVLGTINAIIGFGQLVEYQFNIQSQTLKTPMFGTIGSANGFGLMMALAILAGQIVVVPKWTKMLGVGIMLAALIINGSRGGILALLVGFSALIFLRLEIEKRLPRVRLRQTLLVIGLTAVMTVAGLYALNPESARGRFMVWEITSQMIEDNPYTGLGHGAYAHEYLDYQARFFDDPTNQEYAFKAANLKQAHNEFLQAFAETGILGGVLFLCIFVLVTIQLIKERSTRENGMLLALVMAIVIHSLVDTPLHLLPISAIFYILLGLVPQRSFRIFQKKGIFSLHLISGFLFIFTLGVVYQAGKFSLSQHQVFLGTQMSNRQHWKGAIKHYEKAKRIFPSTGQLDFLLGAALVMDGQKSRGVASLHRARKCFNDRNLQLSLAFGYLGLRNYSEAEKHAIFAARMFPDHLAPKLILGEVFLRKGNIEDAKRYLATCILEQTVRKSDDTKQISIDATNLWEQFIQEPVPE